MTPRAARLLASLLPSLLLPPGAVAQDPPAADTAQVQAADITAFTAWLKEYEAGTFRLVKDGSTDEAAVAALDARMAKVAAWNTLEAARMLFAAASVEPKAPGARTSTELVDFYRELQPWRVQALACKHLRAMTSQDVLPWLLAMLNAKGLRAAQPNQDQRNAAAVLRVLAGHPSVEAQLELLRACRAMPSELRVQAVAAMAKNPTLELLPTLLELLRDAEPNVRIAAANAIGEALQPHVDETLGKQPDAATVGLRDQAVEKLEALLLKDTIWQVRSSAAFALAVMRCKAVVPALIKGLEAELGRKKDPWAMDVRLHKILEGLTGQTVVRGSAAPWKAFWAAEGAAFTVRPKPKPGEKPAVADKYEKFFDLEVESDRVLFVLDFSGSMAEPAKLTPRGTGTAGDGGVTAETTKAALVVSELKKLILSLPDGALVNLVVFGDDVRVWREEGGRPALVKLDDESRDDLLGNFLDNLRPSGSTNLYGALDRALEFGDRGLYDKYYAAGFDTLYVISDGAPTAGAVVDKEEIRRRVRERNGLRKVTIHCITFGEQNDMDFLRSMAEENGGRHIHVD
ncbi:MAG: HEAT repeat domain-containing protein [Planctomycetes bacterium]|nr:HEAT repeat domain-containing protein [Planctomycetota bacterium]